MQLYWSILTANFGGGYVELGMDNEPPEPWDFGDTPSKPPYYWNKRDLLQSAQEGEPGASDLLLQRWLITGSQYHDWMHELWLQHRIENEERKHKELKLKLPPPALTIIPPQPSLHPVTPSPAPSLPINHNNNNLAKTTTPARPPPWPYPLLTHIPHPGQTAITITIATQTIPSS